MAVPACSGIYEIVNTVNGKRYVGSAVNLRIRKRQHLRELRVGKHHCAHLQSAWAMYGEGAFEFHVLFQCEKDDLLACEQKEIDIGAEYNTCKVAGSTLGVRHSVETRRKISEKKTGSKMPPRSDDHRLAISAALTGKSKSDAHMAALQEGRANQVFTDDRRERVSASLKRAYAEGRKTAEKSPEHRDKIAATLTGRKASDQSRANQSAAQRGKKRGPYKLDPAKAEARREAGRALAAATNEIRWGFVASS